MGTTRRSFLKTSAIATAGLAVPASARPSAGSSEASPATASAGSPLFTRGIGFYPGAASENFDPTLLLDAAAPYRNLALLRPAFASSSYDYNLTAQLLTDGIVDIHLPTWVTTVINGEVLPKQQRESLIDHFPENVVELPGLAPTVEFHLGGGVQPPPIDRVALFVVVPEHTSLASLRFTVSASQDGHLWHPLGTGLGSTPLEPANYPPDLVRGNVLLTPSIAFSQPSESRFYRLEFTRVDGSKQASTSPDTSAAVAHIPWRLGQVEFYHGATRVEIGGPYHFTSAWKSAGLDEEWIFVDLGALFRFDRVKLHWLARASEGKLQGSDDAVVWHDLKAIPSAGTMDDLPLATPAIARYVRVLMTRPATGDGYILSEVEVFGNGGFMAKAAPAAEHSAEILILSGGDWRLQRAPQVAAPGETISAPGFRNTDWIVATVPGTILTSYLNVGAIPDPNFGENQLHISDSFFYADFWYRTEFQAPAPGRDALTWLSFEGVNWKAEIFLNGARLGTIAGGFTRGRFEVSSLLHAGRPNALAVLIRKNDTPGSCKQKTYQTTGKNGGGLGADNPTYHASIGWDWIPTIRGRNTGIWADVRLTTSGAVTLEDPLVTSIFPLPDHSVAEVSLEVIAVNHTPAAVSGTLTGSFGALAFTQPMTLAANERRVLKLSPTTHAQLRIAQPELWWPVGYGDPHLYPVKMQFESLGNTQHQLNFNAGIRQMTATEDGGALRLFINGRRFIARGGNWGFGESMLRYRAREYEVAVRYHREQNFNMVRDWVGQIGDDAFYEACDRHGLVVWQDFWLANPWDGPVPNDSSLFLANARDYLLRIRRHASIGLYCGRNEWFPPAALDAGLRQLLAELHPDLHYIGSSADGPVSGHGPYRTLSAPNYFRAADRKLHSEIGAPAIPPIESVRAMMPAEALWPQGLSWGLHDFTLSGAQGGSALLTLIEEAYGGARDAEEWVTLAQFLNYNTYRAIFEAQSTFRMGVLLWMSHSCWPSFVWQTYDYYFEPTAAYFGSRKGSEPLHIQWNSEAESIEVVNYSAGRVANLTAKVEVLNLDGVTALQHNLSLSSEEDSTQTVLQLVYPANLSAVQFLRLTLTQDIGKVLSTNFYLRGLAAGDYRAIRTLPKVSLQSSTAAERRADQWRLTTTLRNPSQTPALMIRMKAVRHMTRDRILPVLYDDNYFALMPREARTITTTLQHADTRGERPEIVVEGFNVVAIHNHG